MPLSDAELLARRAARIGKPVPDATATEGTSNRGDGPSSAPRLRDPATSVGQVPDFLASLGEIPDEIPEDTNTPPAPPSDTGTSDASLRQQLAAANGRVAPLQQKVEELTGIINAQAQQIAALTQAVEKFTADEAARVAAKQAEEFDPLADMTPEEAEALDPVAREILRKATRKVYQATANRADPETLINSVLAKRDAAELKTYVHGVALGLGLNLLAKDEGFKTFVSEDDSAELLITSFMGASDIASARALEPRLKAMLKRYEKSKPNGGTQRPTDATPSLGNHLRRTNTGGNGGSAVTTPEQVREIRQKASMLSRRGMHKEAQALLATLNN